MAGPPVARENVFPEAPLGEARCAVLRDADYAGKECPMHRGLLCIVLIVGMFVSGCSYTQTEWLGRKLSGIDCRPEKLDVAGRERAQERGGVEELSVTHRIGLSTKGPR